MTAYIAMGANLGDRASNIFNAVARLSRTQGIRIGRVSSLIETPAVGGPANSPPFLNAAMQLQTALQPQALLAALLETERGLGRVRKEHWGPRAIDLDLLLYGDQVLSMPQLTVPHPLMHTRRFVLEPLAEIAPQAIHPILNQSVEVLLRQLPQD